MIQYLQNNHVIVWQALQEHLYLALLPILFGLVIALPLGYLPVRFPKLYHPLVNTFGVLYSIPSLALFVFLPVILGTKVLSPINVIVALTIYTVALLARTVADGLRAVDAVVVQAATAMGYRRLRRLIEVELPIALPVILAGLRVATVSNISLVSVGSLIGIGGLGQLFTRGFQLFYMEPILIGIILSVVLAGIADLIIVLVQRAITPWTRAA
ncbi:ABC transporter permease [Actinoplanes derwentensis]|uniref:Osmoprotectant transport system permease protein n=1 Tax=Actinoplanes derwentensis TaxID=113562 RepID=A0A1H1TRU5_9ACTN|nr:ABC transporter permease subunit [Actinoplanes derwentensis]GID85115.1 glycine/betaine ABC transporter permease [Actinoplanes derwentensis]SDS62938.1 osmoprotectant transport system permease protein [Actinoplanes derwentensis]